MISVSAIAISAGPIVMLVGATVMLVGATDTVAQSPKFDVASVKPLAAREFGSGIGAGADQFRATNVTLSRLLAWTYFDNAVEYRIVGGPSWIRSDHFTIQAKYPPAMRPQAVAMVKTLLAERFHLRVHQESREGDVYSLVTARPDGRLGPSLRRAEVPCEERTREKTADKADKGPLDGLGCMTLASDRFVRAAARPLSSLATTLTVVVGAPVVDRTGLDGKFDYSMEWTPDPPSTAGAPALPLTGLFTALQEQLGLKLEPGRGPVDVLVVDAVERPDPD